MWYSKINNIISYLVLFAILIPGICYSQNNSRESSDSEMGPNWEHSLEDYWPFPNPDAGYVSDRKARIELGAGYGRSRDADSRRIMNNIITPKFKNADYAGGITAGVKAMALEFAQARIGLNWPLIILLAAVPILVLIAISLFMSGKHGWACKIGAPGFNQGQPLELH